MDNLKNEAIKMFYDALLYAYEGENPTKAIDNQIKRASQSVISHQRLPKKLNDHLVPKEIRFFGVDSNTEFEKRMEIILSNNINYTKLVYEMMGITIIDEHNNLFYNVTLPEGWQIKPKVDNTDGLRSSDMYWLELLDNKNRRRADIFYKGTIYDSDSFINFCTRFHLDVSHTENSTDTDFDTWAKSDYQGTIKDGDTIIFKTDCVPSKGNYKEDEKIQKDLMKILEDYMDQNYPDYEDINAYWD